MIGGKEYMLSGRFETRFAADDESNLLCLEWHFVKVLKINHILGCYSCWVHGAK